MEIIGLSGYARSGKDETARTLIRAHGFQRVAFADKLREVLYKLNPRVALSSYMDEDAFGNDRLHQSWVTVQDVVDRYGWDGYKEKAPSDQSLQLRELLQRLGTEAGRQTLGENIWVDSALTGHPEDARLVVTDVRFPNEAQRIKDLGGVVWRVKRPGVGPANYHESETALDDWPFDAVLENDGNLVDLSLKVNRFYMVRK